MISCERGTHTTNLYYSALKFLRYEGIVWSGDFLPLKLNSLGEVFQINISLKRSDGTMIKAVWERGMLIARFEPGYVYDLEMRIEYCLPISIWEFKADFESVHPKTYLVALDFSTSSLTQDRTKPGFRMGEMETRLDLKPFKMELADGGSVEIHEQADYYSLQLRKSGDSPYCHNHFPTLFLS